MEQMAYIRDWGGRFVVPIPRGRGLLDDLHRDAARRRVRHRARAVGDERGFFARTWCEREFAAHGLETRIAQCNISFNRRRARCAACTTRRRRTPRRSSCAAPAARSTTSSSTCGRSPTFHGHFAIVLSADCRKTLYVPKGFAHGFQTLEDDTEVFYQMSQFYSRRACARRALGRPGLRIRWPDAVRTIADRDRSYPNVGRVEAALDMTSPSSGAGLDPETHRAAAPRADRRALSRSAAASPATAPRDAAPTCSA